MFIVKKKYFLIIENIKDIDLKNIKIRNKFSIIYRNKKNNENFDDVKELMDSIMNRMDSRKYIRHSSTFRNFNKTFNFEKDWWSKETKGYGEKSILSHGDEIIKLYFPNFILLLFILNYLNFKKSINEDIIE